MARRLQVVRVSSKGQIVIPQDVRRRLGLKTGSSLRVRTSEEGEVILSPMTHDSSWIEEARDRFAAWAKEAGRDLVEELHQHRRHEREREASRRDRWRD